ncbi:MAG: hypothetical protein AN487_19850, partial [Anabaena sp. CRKS33]
RRVPVQRADRLGGRLRQRGIPEHRHRVGDRVQVRRADPDVAVLQGLAVRVSEDREGWGYAEGGHAGSWGRCYCAGSGCSV